MREAIKDQRMHQDICLRCGTMGHFRANCPLYKEPDDGKTQTPLEKKPKLRGKSIPKRFRQENNENLKAPPPVGTSASPSSEEDDVPDSSADSSLSEAEDSGRPAEVILVVPAMDGDSTMAQVTMALIDKLTDPNYSSWSLKMEWFLKREALWRFVHNPPPSPMSAADSASDEKALAHIILSLSDSQLVFVRSQ
ncbi:UNVERIFIED_CONTAM: hypothetical protein K2H54_043614 [Gekko kuhli]